MKNTHQGILLGLGLLGAGALVGPINSASAQPRDVRQARREVKGDKREVKQERRDLNRANTPFERRDAQHELRDARHDLKHDQRDLRDEKRENGSAYRPGYGTTYRPGVIVRPGTTYRPGVIVRPGTTYRPGTVIRSGGSVFGSRTLEGTVTNDLSGNDFVIRTNNGQTVRVLMPSGEPGSLSKGDLVRVSGGYSGNIFNARSTSILVNR